VSKVDVLPIVNETPPTISVNDLQSIVGYDWAYMNTIKLNLQGWLYVMLHKGEP
jgi:hypothetical protein